MSRYQDIATEAAQRPQNAQVFSYKDPFCIPKVSVSHVRVDVLYCLQFF